MAELEAQKGTKRVQRVGEQFYMTCTCLATEVSSDPNDTNKFLASHILCRQEEK
jgi:hypothetical protein